MTVSELLAHLAKLDPAALVYIDAGDPDVTGVVEPVHHVDARDGTVYLIAEWLL